LQLKAVQVQLRLLVRKQLEQAKALLDHPARLLDPAIRHPQGQSQNYHLELNCQTIQVYQEVKSPLDLQESQ
jgi:hypothetical protein